MRQYGALEEVYILTQIEVIKIHIENVIIYVFWSYHQFKVSILKYNFFLLDIEQ